MIVRHTAAPSSCTGSPGRAGAAGVPFALLLLWSLAGCRADDGCEQLCVHAEEKFSACLEEKDAEWGASVGFTSEPDFQDWCSTFIWEERELGRGDQCPARQAVIDDGDCAAWYTAWGDTF